MRKESEYADVVARRLDELRVELGGDGDPPPAESSDDSWQPPWWDGPVESDEVVPEPDDEAVELGDPLLPVPGRHASRRRIVISPDAVLPEPLRGRLTLTPWHLVSLAVLVAVGLAVTCWWMIRASPEVVPASAPASASSAEPSPSTDSLVSLPAAAASGAVTPSGGASAGTVTVDVEGKVRRPGIVVLPTGSRVVDAIKAAGGATARQLSALNQAAVLSDGQQIVVGTPAVPAGTGASQPAASGASGAPNGPVSLNSASLQDLDTLPGVGPVTAQAILDWRTQNGAFTSLDELLEVDGIGPVTFEKLKPMVTL